MSLKSVGVVAVLTATSAFAQGNIDNPTTKRTPPNSVDAQAVYGQSSETQRLKLIVTLPNSMSKYRTLKQRMIRRPLWSVCCSFMRRTCWRGVAE